MNNETLNNAISSAEREIEISLINNTAGNTKVAGVPVNVRNTLWQIVDQYAEDLGIDKEAELLFTNKRTGKQTADKNMTVSDFGLDEGDCLLISDDATVG
ncbi:MAG: hypothetical protein IJT70_05715 [Clostridia bacterium]|nr:hypothetical protein [Clostridia bacterium]